MADRKPESGGASLGTRKVLTVVRISEYRPYMGALTGDAHGDFNSDKESFPRGRIYDEPIPDRSSVSRGQSS